jgi:hypothetical protein
MLANLLYSTTAGLGASVRNYEDLFLQIWPCLFLKQNLCVRLIAVLKQSG